jgi:MFS family permease
MIQIGDKKDYLVGKGWAHYFFILLFLITVIDYLDRMVVTALFPFMKTDLGLSDTQLGLLVSVIFWSVTIFALPTAYVLDRWSRKKGIGISVILWSIACAVIGFLKSFPAIFSILQLLSIFLVFAGAMFFIGSFFYNRDRDRVEHVMVEAE